MAGLELIAGRSGWVLAAALGLLVVALAVLVDLQTGTIRLEPCVCPWSIRIPSFPDITP